MIYNFRKVNVAMKLRWKIKIMVSTRSISLSSLDWDQSVTCFGVNLYAILIDKRAPASLMPLWHEAITSSLFTRHELLQSWVKLGLSTILCVCYYEDL